MAHALALLVPLAYLHEAVLLDAQLALAPGKYIVWMLCHILSSLHWYPTSYHQ